MENNIIGILTKLGENDYSLWQPEIPADDPLLIVLLDKYGNSGGSVRGNAAEIRSELLPISDAVKCHVHLIIYHDPDDDYIGCDVFDNFDAALEQFDGRLQDVRMVHPDWVEQLDRNPDKHELYFRDHSGYEVFYRYEVVQSKACPIVDCHFCGQPYRKDDIGQQIHYCSVCGKPFCNGCFKSMTGTSSFNVDERTVLLCPSCELRHSIRQRVTAWLSDYAGRMPESFYQEVYEDVCETSGFNQGEGFNDSDIHLSFCRVIAKQFGVEEE